VIIIKKIINNYCFDCYDNRYTCFYCGYDFIDGCDCRKENGNLKYFILIKIYIKIKEIGLIKNNNIL
jgi:hypothetical protein